MMSAQHNVCERISKFFGWRKTTSLESTANYVQGVSGGGFAAVERDCSEREASQNVPKRGGYVQRNTLPRQIFTPGIL